MATGIEWTDETWNPVVGCAFVSDGCTNCYAAREAAGRLSGVPVYVGLATKEPGDAARFTGEIRCLPERLELALRWRRPRMVFVNSMSDLFHPDVPDAFVARVFAVMATAEQHTFQVLTKRPQRMAGLLASEAFGRAFFSSIDRLRANWQGRYSFTAAGLYRARLPLRNVWLGTSVEDQRYADLRIPHLLATPAAVRFLSCEPLLGPVDLDRWLRPLPDCGHADADDGTCRHPLSPTPECNTGVNCPLTETWRGVDWVIAGGESGPAARPMHPSWVEHLRDHCATAGIPFFFKQWGEWIPDSLGGTACVARDGTHHGSHEPHSDCSATGVWLSRAGKKAAGRELGGRTWDELPLTEVG